MIFLITFFERASGQIGPTIGQLSEDHRSNNAGRRFQVKIFIPHYPRVFRQNSFNGESRDVNRVAQTINNRHPFPRVGSQERFVSQLFHTFAHLHNSLAFDSFYIPTSNARLLYIINNNSYERAVRSQRADEKNVLFIPDFCLLLSHLSVGNFGEICACKRIERNERKISPTDAPIHAR